MIWPYAFAATDLWCHRKARTQSYSEVVSQQDTTAQHTRLLYHSHHAVCHRKRLAAWCANAMIVNITSTAITIPVQLLLSTTWTDACRRSKRMHSITIHKRESTITLLYNFQFAGFCVIFTTLPLPVQYAQRKLSNNNLKSKSDPQLLSHALLELPFREACKLSDTEHTNQRRRCVDQRLQLCTQILSMSNDMQHSVSL
jgi:hypothetical protein